MMKSTLISRLVLAGGMLGAAGTAQTCLGNIDYSGAINAVLELANPDWEGLNHDDGSKNIDRIRIVELDEAKGRAVVHCKDDDSKTTIVEEYELERQTGANGFRWWSAGQSEGQTHKCMMLFEQSEFLDAQMEKLKKDFPIHEVVLTYAGEQCTSVIFTAPDGTQKEFGGKKRKR